MLEVQSTFKDKSRVWARFTYATESAKINHVDATACMYFTLFHKLIYSYTQELYPCTVSLLVNVNWSAFLKGILLTLVTHECENGVCSLPVLHRQYI